MTTAVSADTQPIEKKPSSLAERIALAQRQVNYLVEELAREERESTEAEKRLAIARKTLNELFDELRGEEQRLSAVEASYESRTKAGIKVNAGGFKGLGGGRIGMLVVLVLMVGVGSWRGGVYVETQANASSSVTTIELVDSIVEADAYWLCDEDTRRKIRDAASDETRARLEREERDVRGGGR